MKKLSKAKRIPIELEEVIKRRVDYTGNTFTEECRNLVAIHKNLGRKLKLDLDKIPVVKIKKERRPIFPNKRLFELR